MENFATIDAASLHAIGAIVDEWNHCEMEMFILVERLSRMDAHKLKILIGDANNVEIAEKAKSLCKFINAPPDVQAVIVNYCAVFDVCRINRNSIVHAWPEGKGFRTQKGHSLEKHLFAAPLNVLREVADEITLCRARLVKLNDALRRVPRCALPDTLPVPKTRWLPPQPAQTKQPHRQKSSQP